MLRQAQQHTGLQTRTAVRVAGVMLMPRVHAHPCCLQVEAQLKVLQAQAADMQMEGDEQLAEYMRVS